MDVFAEKYIKNAWGGGSGIGSKSHNTKEYRSFLSGFIKSRCVESINDIGCGDWQIMELISLYNIKYTGYDCVDFVIRENNSKFKAFNIDFQRLNLVNEKPNEVFDLALIKDVLQHLSFDSIFKLLANIKEHKFTLITNDTTCNKNVNINDGDYRPLNLSLPPFCFGLPIFTYTVPIPQNTGKEKAMYLLEK